MKKLVCLSLAVALGITCYETDAMGRLKKTLAQGVATRAEAGQEVSEETVSKLPIEKQIDYYITLGNKACFTENWSEVLTTPGVTVPIVRLMSRVDRRLFAKADVLLADNFANSQQADDGSVSISLNIRRINYYQFGGANASFNDALAALDGLDLAHGQVRCPAQGGAHMFPIDNMERLVMMGALYAVAKGLGIPDTRQNARRATSDDMLIGEIGTNNLVAPWTNADGTPATNEQKLRAAKLYYKIAKTLE